MLIQEHYLYISSQLNGQSADIMSEDVGSIPTEDFLVKYLLYCKFNVSTFVQFQFLRICTPSIFLNFLRKQRDRLMNREWLACEKYKVVISWNMVFIIFTALQLHCNNSGIIMRQLCHFLKIAEQTTYPVHVKRVHTNCTWLNCTCQNISVNVDIYM